MTPNPGGFDAQRHVYWPAVASALSTPWPREACCMDLLWWVAEVRIFRRAFPSRSQFTERWGWTDRRVRDLLASVQSWQDPVRTVSLDELRPERKTKKVQPTSSEGPDKVQPTSNGERMNADNTQKVSSEGPDKVQPTSSEGPQARVSPCTDHPPLMGVGTATAPAVETPPDLPMLLQGDHATLAALVACRVLTVDDLTKLTMGRLRSIRGIGPKRALTIREALVAHGLDLVTEDLPPARRTVERPGQRNLSDRWCAAFTASTGQEYRWTAKGRTSDQAAVATLYDVVGWSAEPSEAVVADAGGTVRRYLGECKRLGQVPTLTHMVAQLPRWRQTVDQRAGPVDRRASIFEQMLAANDNTAPSRIVIDIPTTEAAK